jgi:hypothetical protein
VAQNVLKSAADRAPADPEMLRQAATDAGESMPSAVVRRDRRTVLVNVEMAERSAITRAKEAKARTSSRRTA